MYKLKGNDHRYSTLRVYIELVLSPSERWVIIKWITIIDCISHCGALWPNLSFDIALNNSIQLCIYRIDTNLPSLVYPNAGKHVYHICADSILHCIWYSRRISSRGASPPHAHNSRSALETHQKFYFPAQCRRTSSPQIQDKQQHPGSSNWVSSN